MPAERLAVIEPEDNGYFDTRTTLNFLVAVKRGDFTVRLPHDWTGIGGKIADTLNELVERKEKLVAELDRVSRTVGAQGQLSQRAQSLGGADGGWSSMLESVNALIGNLALPTTEMARVIGAVAKGDLTQSMMTEIEGQPLQGEILRTAKTVNSMVTQLNGFAAEVTRVAREVGTEGKLGGQADAQGVAGTWKDLTDSVNSMASNLTAQVRNIADVTTAVANGDLSKKITVDVRGEILQLKDTINTMVEQLRGFASEVTRVAREVGTDGKLGGQAIVPGVAGTWKDLTDNVNSMANNLTAQVRNIADVTTAVARGDLARKITVDAMGEILELKNTINTMVDQLNGFAAEVTRVAREVGTEGKLGGQADVPGVSGTWKDLTDSVNSMANNLTAQVRNIADVTTAVASGDLSKKITVDVRGEILQLKETINTMVEQLRGFAAEVTRVAREVGTEGKLGGQADVKGVSGTWKDLTDNVNSMANNLTNQVRNIAQVTTAVANGDLSKKITVDVRGEILELKNTINTMVDQLNGFSAEVTRVAREVGTEGKLGGQADVRGVAGTWKDLTESVNGMAANLTGQVRNIAQVTTAVANGDLARKITVDARGEILELKDTINTMVDQLNGFASEVTRVAREVGTEGKLGGQADVRGVSGTWKDLTDNVNIMAANLTEQVRNIAKVVTAVANGNLKLMLTVKAKGEIASLSDTINNMIETLATFADQVTTVAREVGVEGKLGGQANVPGAAGTWKNLTDNVNQLAANLTTQVRAIADVATAVTKGDLTRSVQVEALGEVAELKDNVNQMIGNLRETTKVNTDQDWLKSNLAKFTRMLQGQREMVTVSRSLLSELSPLVNAQHGAMYVMETVDNLQRLKLMASYGFKERKGLANEWMVGEGLVGQCAFEKQRILLTNVPPDYVQITSGLGHATPLNIVVLPVVFEGQVKAVIELGSFNRFTDINVTFLEQLTESVGIVVNTIEAGTRTEQLLTQSQDMAKALQSQQEELQQTNEELQEKARLLVDQKAEVERKNKEVERVKTGLEEKASQLAVTSKYKSEFLSNMSHELRTPLNSLLILAQQLEENLAGNLTEQQVRFAKTIHGSGMDLLNLINEILDLSKIESGTVILDLTSVSIGEIRDQIERTFRHMAAEQALAFAITVDPAIPARIHTDARRLLQMLKNLLANAFKFTERGEVQLRIEPATRGWTADHPTLSRAGSVIAFHVRDTGIGIPPEKQRIIFEAFQQADAGTGRKYGGTGLGLAISREIAGLLGGEIKLTASQPGEGSTFSVFLPQTGQPPPPPAPVGPSWGGPPAPVGPSWGGPPASVGPSWGGPPASVGPSWGGPPAPVGPSERAASSDLPDDRERIEPTDRVLLVVEDDPAFARILMDAAREKGFKCVVATGGQEAVRHVQQYRPSAITLDLRLPDMAGWSVLDRLKLDPTTRHIPVQLISVDEARDIGLKRGAYACLKKPVDHAALLEALGRISAFIQRPERRLLVVEDDEAERRTIVAAIAAPDIRVTEAATASEALDKLIGSDYDAIVLDLKLPDRSGIDLLEQMQTEPRLRDLPILVYTARTLTEEEAGHLDRLAQRVVLKTPRSLDRLLAETTLFLHRVSADLPEQKRAVLDRLYQADTDLAGKKVLLVDDDVRNIFALTTVLERHEIQVIPAEGGREALAALAKTPDIGVILMDIMMPEMDGYETMQAIRRQPAFAATPIIALTAKAMKGDREKCLEAGASDYVAKPVNTEQLLSLLRVWTHAA